jgi:hypothetical protein
MGVIDDHLEDLGDSQRAELERIRRIVLDRVPDAEEGRFTEAKPIPEDVIWEILDLRLEEIG